MRRDTAALNAGFNVGEPYCELENARLRFFGGTTAIWGGRSAELDAIDFEKRSWVPYSGWPFGLEEIKPWYSAAWKLLEVELSFAANMCERPRHGSMERTRRSALVFRPEVRSLRISRPTGTWSRTPR